MIRGMTGFGYSQIKTKNVTGIVEMKSVNHRYLDVGYYLPVGFASIEEKIRQLIRNQIARGRVTVSFKITSKPEQNVSFNNGVARDYLKQSKTLKKKLGLKGELSLEDILQLPGVVTTCETIVSPAALWPAIDRAIRQAIAGLVVMRKREGKALCRDISGQLKRMLLQINKIKARAKIRLQEKKKSFSQEEFLSFQKSTDINEELTRLRHHVEEFAKLLKSEGTVGKKLDFVAQEMQRETNTIGSKLQDKIVSNAVIALKSKIEKIREQAQNIE